MPSDIELKERLIGDNNDKKEDDSSKFYKLLTGESMKVALNIIAIVLNVIVLSVVLTQLQSKASGINMKIETYDKLYNQLILSIPNLNNISDKVLMIQKSFVQLNEQSTILNNSMSTLSEKSIKVNNDLNMAEPRLTFISQIDIDRLDPLLYLADNLTSLYNVLDMFKEIGSLLSYVSKEKVNVSRDITMYHPAYNSWRIPMTFLNKCNFGWYFSSYGCVLYDTSKNSVFITNQTHFSYYFAGQLTSVLNLTNVDINREISSNKSCSFINSNDGLLWWSYNVNIDTMMDITTSGSYWCCWVNQDGIIDHLSPNCWGR